MGEKGSVCVTGAGGFVASWLVKLLLSKGYMVHGTVRDPGDEKNSHLKRLEKAQENLILFKANLLDYNSLCAAIVGCSGVFHVASPVPSSLSDNPETELLEAAVKGTLNVLKVCSETGVERVVVVSSTTAVVNNPNWPPNRPMDEDCWSDIVYCRETTLTFQNVQPTNDHLGPESIFTNQVQWYNWYCIAKTTSEREALKYAENSGLDVVTVCASRVLGPLLQLTVNASSQLFSELFKDNRVWVIVDVQDVAEALLLVYEKKEASGRYICASHLVRVESVVEMLKTKYPYYNYPKNYIEAVQEVKLSSEKLKKLGWECRSLQDTIVDSVECYQEAGILNKD
ncbi:hypothetical protein AAC387_Pa02g0523 [Persea americana]